MNIPFLQTATFTGLVSTDEYRTSYEWNKAYELATGLASTSAVLIQETTFGALTAAKAQKKLYPGQRYLITDFELKWWNLGINDKTVKSSGVIEPLVVLALSSDKIDIQCSSLLHPEDVIYYDVDATYSYSWGTPGSPEYTNDPIPSFKGWILRRVDQKRDIDIAWDWRYITNNCCQFNVGVSVSEYSIFTTYSKNAFARTAAGKIYYSARDNNLNHPFNDVAWWLPLLDQVVEQSVYFPTNENGLGGPTNDFLTLQPVLSSRTQLLTFPQGTNNIKNIKITSGYNNIINSTNFLNNTIGDDFSYNWIGTNFTDNKVGNNCRSNTLGNLIKRNVIGDGFIKNICNSISGGLTPKNMEDCHIGDNFYSNITNYYFLLNVINNDCINNIFHRFTFNNTIGTTFQNNSPSLIFSNSVFRNNITNNTIGENFIYNVLQDSIDANLFGSNISYNSFGSSFTENTVGNSFQYNTIGNNCTINSIGNNCVNNVISNGFESNSIGNSFSNNTIFNDFKFNTITNNFQLNTIRNNIQSIDFSSATHVYNNYDTTIYKNSASTNRLSYYNQNDQLVVTDPTN